MDARCKSAVAVVLVAIGTIVYALFSIGDDRRGCAAPAHEVRCGNRGCRGDDGLIVDPDQNGAGPL